MVLSFDYQVCFPYVNQSLTAQGSDLPFLTQELPERMGNRILFAAKHI